MPEINVNQLLHDVRAAAAKADRVLESDKIETIKYAESLADLLDAFDVLDSWLTDTEGKDLPAQWTNPESPPTLDSPF